jgi:hypothetical protein
VTVTPDDLKRLKKLVDVTGSSVTIGIPLGTYDPQRGADMAAHAVDILGDSLVGLAIGNEPNGYTVDDVPGGAVRGEGWNRTNTWSSSRRMPRPSMRRRPDAPIIGPDVYDGAWMEAFAGLWCEEEDRALAALVSALRMRFLSGSGAGTAGGEPHRSLGEEGGEEEPRHREIEGRRRGTAAVARRDRADELPGHERHLADERVGAVGGRLHAVCGHARCRADGHALDARGLQWGSPDVAHLRSGRSRGPVGLSFRCGRTCSGCGCWCPVSAGNSLGLRWTGGGNMSAYTVVKNDGRTLVTTVINANDAAKVGGNPVTVSMPSGFSVSSASQVYGESNDVKSATQVVPANPLPASVPFSGDGAGGSSASASPSGGASSSPASNGGVGDDGKLRIDLAGSSVTVFVMSQGVRGFQLVQLRTF